MQQKHRNPGKSTWGSPGTTLTQSAQPKRSSEVISGLIFTATLTHSFCCPAPLESSQLSISQTLTKQNLQENQPNRSDFDQGIDSRGKNKDWNEESGEIRAKSLPFSSGFLLLFPNAGFSEVGGGTPGNGIQIERGFGTCEMDAQDGSHVWDLGEMEIKWLKCPYHFKFKTRALFSEETKQRFRFKSLSTVLWSGTQIWAFRFGFGFFGVELDQFEGFWDIRWLERGIFLNLWWGNL